MDVGCIGLGKMGQPMARRLLSAGHTVHLFNRSPGATEALRAEGGRPAGSVVQVVERAEIVLTILPTPESVESVYRKMFGFATSGQLFVDHSTVAPDLSRRCAELLKPREARFLDAPISGGPEGAAAGTLTVMVGGDAADLDEARPVFESFGGKITLCGPVGSGQIVKLINQLLVAIHTAAIAEAAVLGTSLGADAELLLDVISNSYGDSVMVGRNLPRFIERNFEAGGSVNTLSKDLGLIQTEALHVGAPLPIGSLVAQYFQHAMDRGLAEEDIAIMVRLWEERAGVTVGREQG